MLNNLFSRRVIFLTATASVFTLITAHKATAQIISDIAVDPYNDSSYQAEPIDIGNSQNKAQQKEITNKIYINAPATPQPPQQINGNLTSSNQFLPAIPSIAEPYSEQQKADSSLTNENRNYNNSTVSVSVSPFDITPTDDNNNSLVNQRQNNQRRTISVSPSNSNSNQNSNLNQNQNQNQNQPQQTNNQVVNVPKPNVNKTKTKTKTKVSRFNRNRRLNLKQVLNNSQGNSNGVNTNTNTKVNYTQTTGNNSNSSIVSSIGNQKVYKVLVKVKNEADKEQIKSLYPEAFTKKINGESFLQIGLFSSQENVDQVSRELDLIGFKAIVN